MPKNITVTVDDDHLSGIEGIADQLRAAGMQIHQVLDSVGVITGEVTDAVRPAISEVPGVAEVVDQHLFQLPPPDAEIQ
jgi:hypothetical protein